MSAETADLTARPKPGLFILVAMSALGPMALNIFIPSMPGLRVALGTDYATTQLTLTLYLASMAVSQLFVGPISDRYGRRPVVLAGTAMFIVASLFCAFAVTIEQLIIGRILQATGACAGIALSRAIVRDIYSRDKAASLIGYVTMAMAIAPMVSPVIGGLLDQLAGWRTGFYLVAGIGLLVLGLAFGQLHETHHNRSNGNALGQLFGSVPVLLREPVFVGYALNSALTSACFFAFIAGAPFLVTEAMHLTPADYGFYFIMISLGYMLGNFISGRFSARVGSNPLLIIGNMLAITGLVLLCLLAWYGVAGPLSIFLPMSIIAISNGLTIPNATASAISVRPEIAGAGAGLTGFLQIGLGAIATLLVGAMHDGTSMPMISVMVAGGVGAGLFLALALFASRGRSD